MKFMLTDQKKRFLIFEYALLGFLVLCWSTWGSQETFSEPETPDNLEKELQRLLSAGSAQSNNPVELRHLASLYLDLGYGLYVRQEDKMRAFEEGARLAKKALFYDESSARSHFLYAANLGSATELQGLMQGALAIQELQEHVHRTLELDANYAPAHHMLGRMYEELPWFLGGDQDAAGDHLKIAVSLDDHYAPGHLDLGRWYLKHGYHEEAEKEFTWVVETPPREKVWIWERMYRPQARNLLHQMQVMKEGQRAP